MSPTVPMVAVLMSEFIVPICLRGKGDPGFKSWNMSQECPGDGKGHDGQSAKKPLKKKYS